MGRIHPPSHFQAKYAVDSVRYVDELGELLKEAPEVRRRAALRRVHADGIRHRAHARAAVVVMWRPISLFSLPSPLVVVVVRTYILMEQVWW
jgi:hypothetical protein